MDTPFPDPYPARAALPCPEEAPAWFDRIAGARWSPYGYADTPVPDRVLRTLFGAALLTPSSANEQPWRFVVGRRGEGTYDRILATLTEPNQAWARFAPVLGLSFARMTREKSGAPNGTAHRDTGAAMLMLALAATSRGLQLHQMAGFDPVAARAVFAVPEGFEPDVAFALGTMAEEPPTGLSEHFAERDAARRGRRPLDEVLFGGIWGEPLGRGDER